MATHCSIIAGEIPWTEEPAGLHGVTRVHVALGPWGDRESDTTAWLGTWHRMSEGKIHTETLQV